MEKCIYKVPSFSFHIRFRFQASVFISGSFHCDSNECMTDGAGKDSVVNEYQKKEEQEKKKHIHCSNLFNC